MRIIAASRPRISLRGTTQGDLTGSELFTRHNLRQLYFTDLV